MVGQRAIDTATTSRSPAAARALSVSVSARSASKASPSGAILPLRSGQNMKRSSLSGEKARRIGDVIGEAPSRCGGVRPASRRQAFYLVYLLDAMRYGVL